MRDLGYKHIGYGAEADVWSKGRSVIKIVLRREEPESVPLFTEYITSNQGNIHLPVIGVMSTVRDDDGKIYHQVSVELLRPLDPAAKNLIKKITTNRVTFLKRRSFGSVRSEILRLKSENLSPKMRKQLPMLMKTIKDLYIFCKSRSAIWDLSASNVMQRPNGTMVITDPWI